MSDLNSPAVIALAAFRLREGITEAIRNRLAEAQSVISEQPGCLLYHFSVDLLEPDIVRITEHWRSQAALDAHISNDHTAVLVESLVSAGMADFVTHSHIVLTSEDPSCLETCASPLV